MSRSLTPLHSCVAKVTSTRLYTLNHLHTNKKPRQRENPTAPGPCALWVVVVALRLGSHGGHELKIRLAEVGKLVLATDGVAALHLQCKRAKGTRTSREC